MPCEALDDCALAAAVKRSGGPIWLGLADGTTEPTSLDLGSVGEIEIMRGPSSVLYGNSAAGVISVQTEFPDAAKLVPALDGDRDLAAGAAVDLPEPDPRRDGSGVPSAQPIVACAAPVTRQLGTSVAG